jgi:hypothetical protein
MPSFLSQPRRASLQVSISVEETNATSRSPGLRRGLLWGAHTSLERKRWDALFGASDPPAYAGGFYGEPIQARSVSDGMPRCRMPGA